MRSDFCAAVLLSFQFILPITLISFAHHAIKKKLRKLPSWQRMQSRSPTPTSTAGASTALLATTNGSASRRGQTISMQGQGTASLLRAKSQWIGGRLRTHSSFDNDNSCVSTNARIICLENSVIDEQPRNESVQTSLLSRGSDCLLLRKA